VYAARFGESATTTESAVRLGTGVEEEPSTITIWMKLKPKQPRVLVGLGTGVRRIHGPA
jgi:hypothetical protein